jgi:hypothetical protein
MKKMNFRVPDELYAAIACEAKARRMPLSAVVRERLQNPAEPDEASRSVRAGKNASPQRTRASEQHR